jgi:hypothetical protein
MLIEAPAGASELILRRAGVGDGGAPVWSLRFVGIIDEGDLAKIRALVGKAKREHKTPGFLALAGDGGDFDESLAIARWVRGNGMPVLVAGDCVSGCAAIALAVVSKGLLFVERGGMIGVHQAWQEGPDGRPGESGSREGAAALRQLGVPRFIIRKMVATSYRSVAYLTRKELVAAGAHLR